MSESTSNVILRDFIYIDKDRMHSLYSQLFEGVVASMVKSYTKGENSTTKEKKLEENLVEAAVNTENIMLFDYLYNTLENGLNKHLLVIDKSTTRDEIKVDSIIKITGYATIEDYEHLIYLVQNFNDIGMALANLQLKTTGTKLTNNTVEQYAKQSGLKIDNKFATSIVKILENFHGNSMEILVEPDNVALNVCFRALLEREYLRLSANSIRNLYGYKPCMKWTLVGEVTNIAYNFNNRTQKNEGAFADMFSRLDEVDNLFAKMADSDNTIRVAPIAVYIEHECPDYK